MVRISIVIPVYNVEQYLRDCLDSVLKQTMPDWEAVCVNDGSTDWSSVVLEEYAGKDNRIKVIVKSNGGLSSARNTGLDAAKGEYVLFLDSDDWLEPNALQTLADHLDGEDMVCFSGRRFFEETGAYHPADSLSEKDYLTGMDYYNENALQHRDFAFVCAVLRLYNRSFLVEHGLRFKEGIFHEDNLFTPQTCYYAHRVKVIDKCLYNYRVRPHSITTTADTKRLVDMMDVANELASFFIPKSGFDKTVVYRAITHHYQVVFVEAPKDERKRMKELCNWSSYKKVSRTKLRHRVYFVKNRVL